MFRCNERRGHTTRPIVRQIKGTGVIVVTRETGVEAVEETYIPAGDDGESEWRRSRRVPGSNARWR